MNAAVEAHLAAMRSHLANAADLERCGVIGLADAHGRAAARCLERALLAQEAEERPIPEVA